MNPEPPTDVPDHEAPEPAPMHDTPPTNDLAPPVSDASLNKRYAYLFADYNAEMGLIYELDGAIAQLKAKQKTHEDMAAELDAKAEAAKQDLYALESRIAEVAGQLKALNAERGATLNLVSTYNYKAGMRRRHAADNNRQIETRKRQLSRREAMNRLKRAQREFC